MTGVILVHTVHGLVFAVWITAAAFAAVERDLELAARNLGASGVRTFLTVSLPLAAPGILASAIFVFLESLDEFTGTFFVGVPDVITLPLLMFTASIAGNYQIAADHRADPAGAFGRVHAGHRALPQGRRAFQGGRIIAFREATPWMPRRPSN